jgi:hypothetical protein
LAKFRVQAVVAAFGIVPLFAAIDYARNQSWAAAALFGVLFVLVEVAAFWLVPLMTGRGLRGK